MDVSQSSSKCGSSDFSIERILSEDSRKREDNASPNWLCCTRYRPPRLPRTLGSSRVRRCGRHARVPFTGAQASALEAAYARSPYLAPPALRALAAALQLRDDRIKIWFQNRRARERREKSGTITPPHAIALPPTASAQGNLLLPAQWMTHIQTNLSMARQQYELNSDSLNEFDNRFVDSNCPVRIYEGHNRSMSDVSDDGADNRDTDTPLDVESITD